MPLFVSTHYFGPKSVEKGDGFGETSERERETGTLGLVLERWVIRFDRNDSKSKATLSPAIELFRRDVSVLLRVLLVKLRLLPLFRLVRAMRKNVSSSARLEINCATDSDTRGPFLGEKYKLAPLASARSHYGVLAVFAMQSH